MGLAFSVVTDYVPMPYNTFYDLEEQSVFADYVVIMGYDEHVEGSYEAGSVAGAGVTVGMNPFNLSTYVTERSR